MGDGMVHAHTEFDKLYDNENSKQIDVNHDPWKHRSQGMRCATCIWFVKKESTQRQGGGLQPVIGRCRRHAPTMGGYPVVFPADWCGDHRLDENKA